jgi:hypothetical protein
MLRSLPVSHRDISRWFEWYTVALRRANADHTGGQCLEPSRACLPDAGPIERNAFLEAEGENRTSVVGINFDLR